MNDMLELPSEIQVRVLSHSIVSGPGDLGLSNEFEEFNSLIGKSENERAP
jgi:hypothetical protein